MTTPTSTGSSPAPTRSSRRARATASTATARGAPACRTGPRDAGATYSRSATSRSSAASSTSIPTTPARTRSATRGWPSVPPGATVHRPTSDMSRAGGEVSAPTARQFTYDALPGRVVFGAGASRRLLAGEVDRLGASRLLVIATGRERSLAEELSAVLGDRVVGVFTDVRPHVPVEVADRARAAAHEARADALLSVGGGSTTGTAKAVALETALPVIAVPTTYAGSEVTPVWGITDERRKTTGTDLRVLPRVVVYDPDLTVTLPPAITGPSAMNAIAHCVEAFYAPGANPITALVAEEGIRALAAGAPVAVQRPEDQAAAARPSTAPTSRAPPSRLPARACITRCATCSEARTTYRMPSCTRSSCRRSWPSRGRCFRRPWRASRGRSASGAGAGPPRGCMTSPWRWAPRRRFETSACVRRTWTRRSGWCSRRCPAAARARCPRTT